MTPALADLHKKEVPDGPLILLPDEPLLTQIFQPFESFVEGLYNRRLQRLDITPPRLLCRIRDNLSFDFVGCVGDGEIVTTQDLFGLGERSLVSEQRTRFFERLTR
ncbi:MAG: hypothetical protein CL920_18115 [Deltaproteobacteria bacterium]|nr:hypothetical protein [Deltaproteobacteria bacterium]